MKVVMKHAAAAVVNMFCSSSCIGSHSPGIKFP